MTVAKTPKTSVPEFIQTEKYQPGKPEDELMRELGLQRVIKLASNENSFGPSPLAIKAIQEAACRVNRYPDSNGYYLKKAISAKTGVPSENLILGNGSVELVEMLARAYLQPGDNAVTADQTFIMYRIAPAAQKAECIPVPVIQYTYDPAGIIKAINHRSKIVFIANPNNPTGTMLNNLQLEMMLSQIPPDVLVVLDEAYFEYVESHDYPNGIDYLQQFSNLIVLRTFSKIYGLAGIRIGYGMASQQIIDRLEKNRSPFNTNSIAQIAAIAALEDLEHVNRSRNLNRQQREYLTVQLRKLNVPFVESVTNFLLLPVQGAMSIYDALLQKGVIVRPVQSVSQKEGLRVTVGTQEDNDIFLESMRSLIAAGLLPA